MLGKIRLKKRKKGSMLFKRILVSMVCIVTAMSMTLEAGAAENSISAEFDIYEADTIINGLDDDTSSSWYNLYKSFQKPLYYELTDYLLDNKALTWSSNFWNAAFNDDFKKNPAYFYEVIIMGFLKYEQGQSTTTDVLNSKEKTLAITIYSELSEYYVDVASEDKDEVAEKIKEVSAVSGMADAVKIVDSACSTGKELIEAAAEYRALSEAKEERIAILKSARENVTDNAYFTSAVDDVIEKMEKTPISYVRDEALEDLWLDFLDGAWDLIVSDSPIEATLKAIKFEKQVLDVLFNSSDTASNNFKLLVVYIVDTYFYDAVKNAKTAFESAHTEENARAFTACYRAYAEYQMYGLDYTKTFINGIVDSGTLHNAVEQIFFRESITDAKELSAYCDHQISIRTSCLELLDKLPSIFYKKNGLTEISQEVAYVPVTSISFKEPEVVLDHMDDIFLAYAEVTPSNATNKNVTYTSSDPSVLEVPEDGGFATLKKSGTVTITATAEDDGYTATQTVTVGEGKKLTSTAHGKCGKNLDWVLYSDGTLYINGTGEMGNCPEWPGSIASWYSYRNIISKVILSSGVTSIEDSAFSHCSSLKSIDLPKGIVSIGNRAFNDCSSLESADLPGGITYIGEKAFLDCSSLKSINLPKGITSIGYQTFYKCSSLESVDLPEGIISIDMSAFWECSNLKSVDLPVGITNIGSQAFLDCRSLKSINLPEGITSIGDSAFRNCSSLQKIVLPEGITSIKDKVFMNCSSLESIDLPETITCIGDYAFDDCSSLESIDLPEGITSIGKGEFAGCSSLKSINLPKEITSIGYFAFQSCSSLESIDLPKGITNIEEYTFRYCSSLKSITLPKGIISIGDNAFNECSSLKNIDLPEGIISIGDDAFNGCSSLENIDLPKGLTSIGDFVFWSCSSLKSIVLPERLASIGGYEFNYSRNVESVTILNKNIEIYNSDSTFPSTATIYGYTGSTAEAYAEKYGRTFVALDSSGNDNNNNGADNTGSNETNSGDGTNTDSSASTPTGNQGASTNNPNSNLTGGTDSASANNNNNSASEKNIKLTDTATKAVYTVTQPNSTVSYAGTTSKAAKSINVPSTVMINNTTYKVTAIAANAFKNNKKLQTVTIQGNVTTIGASAFQGCISLKSVKTGAKVKTIGSKAFYGCKKLSSLTIGKNVTSIGKSAFQNCTGLKKITIPSKVKKIGSKAFYNCKKLTAVTIKTKKLTAKTVGSKAFTKAGSSNYKKLKLKVPSSKYSAYKKLLKKKGLS